MAKSIASDAPAPLRPFVTALLAVTHTGVRSGEAFHHVMEALLAPYGLVTPDATLAPDTREAIHSACETYLRLVREHAPFQDLLGPSYMAFGSAVKHAWLGQFFTPWPIAQMMSEVQDLPTQLAAKRANGSPDELFTMHDPACGSGVMLLAACDVVRRHAGPDALTQIGVYATDVDRLCARMCAVQLLSTWALHELPLGRAVVQHANSLTLETFATVLDAEDRRRVLARAARADVADATLLRAPHVHPASDPGDTPVTPTAETPPRDEPPDDSMAAD